MTSYPRWAVLTALERARERVAHGFPSVQAALRLERLSERGWAEVDRAMDGARFDLAPKPAEHAPPRRKGESAAVIDLRELLQAAQSNAGLPWEDPEGLSRAQLVTVLTEAIDRVRAMPANGLGPLFGPGLPIIERSET